MGITIGNTTRGAKGEYVGRPSPLGNPYRVDKIGRDAACDAYAGWFADAVRTGRQAQPRIFAELDRLRALHREHGSLVLTCWCAPRRCHAETIRAWLEDNHEEDRDAR